MKVGLFVNTQFPESFSLAERVPEMVMPHVTPGLRRCGSRTTG